MSPPFSRQFLLFALLSPPVILLSSPAEGRLAQRKESLLTCPSAGLLQREGSETCWVRKVEKDYSLCYSKDLWLDHLRHPARTSACGTWNGKWRVFSPALNSTARATPIGIEQKKEVRLSFAARTFKSTFKRTSSSEIPSAWFRAIVMRIELTRERLSEWITPYDPLGICRHLILTEKTPGNPSSLLRELGFVHLLTATGIHLYALSTWSSRIMGLMARFAFRTGIPLTVSLAGASILSGVVWIWAWLLSGARAGMLRPLIVIGARSAARKAGFRWRRWAPISIALGADLLVALIRSVLELPGAWAPGRWIYALAVGGGMLTLDSARGRGAFREHWHLATGSWVLVALLEAGLHHVIAFATPILSLITIPLFCTTIYPAFLSSSLLELGGFAQAAQGLAEMTSWFATQSIVFLFQAIAVLRTLWIVPSWAFAAGALFAGLMLALQSSPKTQKALVVWVAILGVGIVHATKPEETSPAATSVEQLDVSQGDAALIRSASGVGLVDTGPEKALSDSSWIRLFAARDIAAVDWVFLTHFDDDHAGGFRKLKTLMPIQLSPIPFRQHSPESNRPKGRNRSMSSILIPLAGGGFYLSAGDSSARDELRVGAWADSLLKNEPNSGPRILKVSHHGSRFSTSREFLNLVRPTEAWISSGVGNPYGHPTQDVLHRLIENGIPYSRTDLNGNIRWTKGAAGRRRLPSPLR